jgi:hypothetical protein
MPKYALIVSEYETGNGPRQYVIDADHAFDAAIEALRNYHKCEREVAIVFLHEGEGDVFGHDVTDPDNVTEVDHTIIARSAPWAGVGNAKSLNVRIERALKSIDSMLDPLEKAPKLEVDNDSFINGLRGLKDVYTQAIHNHNELIGEFEEKWESYKRDGGPTMVVLNGIQLGYARGRNAALAMMVNRQKKRPNDYPGTIKQALVAIQDNAQYVRPGETQREQVGYAWVGNTDIEAVEESEARPLDVMADK